MAFQLRSRGSKPLASPNYARPSKVARVADGGTVRTPVIADSNDDYAVVSDEQHASEYAEIAPLLQRKEEDDEKVEEIVPPTTETPISSKSEDEKEGDHVDNAELPEVAPLSTTERIEEPRQIECTPPRFTITAEERLDDESPAPVGDSVTDSCRWV